jgi:hypothetical protein
MFSTPLTAAFDAAVPDRAPDAAAIIALEMTELAGPCELGF